MTDDERKEPTRLPTSTELVRALARLDREVYHPDIYEDLKDE